MKPKNRVAAVAALLCITLLAGAISARREVESARGKEATLEEVLYLPSGKVLKRMSLGYSGLLANIYWTRAVQYFGGHFQEKSTHYDLLDPLLEITTDLDPHLIPAYQTGAIFLSQQVPLGAGQPDKAVTLLEKGIRENPEYWRLYFTLGFVHYVDRKDYKAAGEAFDKGSKVPGALGWMRIMAARMAEQSGEISTAIELWQRILDGNTDKNVRENAMAHLDSLHADFAIEALERQVQAYYVKKGALPRAWSDLVREGLLPGIPLDPNREPFRLMPDGTVQVQDPGKDKFLGEFRERNK